MTMFSQFFGQYLLNKGLLTTAQLSECLTLEQSVRVKLGVLAMNAGMLTADQVEEIHELQRSRDKRFGEIAIEKQYLTVEQLDELLSKQSSKQLNLSQAIIDQGYLSLAELERTMANYNQENKLTLDKDGAQVDSTMLEGILQFAGAGENKALFLDYTALFMRNIIRFLDEVPIAGTEAVLGEVAPSDWVATQVIRCQSDMVTGLILKEDCLLEIARRYSQEPLSSVDELARDSIAEFVNLVNGIFCVNASDKGVELDLHFPSVIQGADTANIKGYRIPLTVRFGTVELVVGIVSPA